MAAGLEHTLMVQQEREGLLAKFLNEAFSAVACTLRSRGSTNPDGCVAAAVRDVLEFVGVR